MDTNLYPHSLGIKRAANTVLRSHGHSPAPYDYMGNGHWQSHCSICSICWIVYQTPDKAGLNLPTMATKPCPKIRQPSTTTVLTVKDKPPIQKGGS